MDDTVNHSPDLGSVGQRKGFMESFESKAPKGLSLIASSPDLTPNPFDGYRFLHIGSPLVLRRRFTSLINNLLSSLQLIDTLEGGFDEIVRVIRPERFCQNVLDPCRLSNGPDGRTGDHPRSFGSWFEQDPCCPKFSQHLVGDRFIDDGNFDQVPFGVFNPLSNGLRDFIGLPQPTSHVP